MADVDKGVAQVVAQETKKATQILLKNGWIEAAQHPNLYQVLCAQMEQVNAILAPLDLCMHSDTVRGLLYVGVLTDVAVDGEDWKHPLVRRQRLRLEQSLLVALLRQRYVDVEQQSGIGVAEVRMDLDDLLTQLQVYLSASGSELKDDKRLHTLLESLRVHGVVSEVADNQVQIRPLITHLANPQTLENLLKQFTELAQQKEANDVSG